MLKGLFVKDDLNEYKTSLTALYCSRGFLSRSDAPGMGNAQPHRARLWGNACPFTVTGGPKLLDGHVEVSCFSDTGCGTLLPGVARWGTPLGDPAPIMLNGVHTLSNGAMAAAALTLNTTTQSIQIVIYSQSATSATLCMPATVSSGLFACTGGPYTLNIVGL